MNILEPATSTLINSTNLTGYTGSINFDECSSFDMLSTDGNYHKISLVTDDEDVTTISVDQAPS
jgi:hypothetical protein